MNRTSLIAAVLIGSGACFPTTANAGIIAQFPMNEPSWRGPAPQVIDTSGNGHDGTAIGGANTVADSRFGQVGSFDGIGQLVEVGGSGAISGARSIVVWVNYQPNITLEGMPILTGGTPFNGDFFGIAGANGAGTAGVGAYDLYVDHWGSHGYSSTIAVTPGVWSQVALTYDGANTVNFYIDGQAAGSVVAEGLFNYNINTYTIGGNLIGGTTTLSSADGLMHDLSIYDNELTPAQVLALYQGIGVPEPSGVMLFAIGMAGLAGYAAATAEPDRSMM